MKALLRADFYRLFRSKFFYILSAVALGLSLVTLGLYAVINEFSEMADMGIAVVDALAFQRASFDGTVGYFSAIAAAVFICGDYSGGGMRAKIVIGCGRRKIFYSKLIVCAFVSAVLYLIMQFVVFAFGGAVFGWRGVSAYDAVSLFFTGLFMALAYAAIFASLSVLLQKLSSSLILGIVCIFALNLIVGLLSIAVASLESAAFTRFCEIFARLTPVGQNSAVVGGAEDYWVLSAISAAWVVAAALLVPLRFVRQDLK